MDEKTETTNLLEVTQLEGEEWRFESRHFDSRIGILVLRYSPLTSLSLEGLGERWARLGGKGEASARTFQRSSHGTARPSFNLLLKDGFSERLSFGLKDPILLTSLPSNKAVGYAM